MLIATQTQVLHLSWTLTAHRPSPSFYSATSSIGDHAHPSHKFTTFTLTPSPAPPQVLHLFDTDCALPISQLRLGDLFRWWPRLRELHIQGHLEFSDMGRVLKNNNCLTVLDLYHMHSDMPFTVSGASVGGVKLCCVYVSGKMSCSSLHFALATCCPQACQP